MKITLRILISILRWLLITGIVLFSIATFMGKSYAQTIVFLLIAISLAWWPPFFRMKKWNRSLPLISRISFIGILILIKIVFLGSEPKSSIYITEDHRGKLIQIYNNMMLDWPENTEDIYIETIFGSVHILACGEKNNPPLMMIHAASMGAHSWAENLGLLLNHFRIYSIDNIGEGNKSQLKNPLVFPKSEKEIAELYAVIADSLGIRRSPVLGSSNGGFVAMCYAYFYPERVEALALFGPMGLTQLSGGSVMMMTISSMYPFQFVRDYVARWTMCEDNYVNRKYGDWFNCIMEGTIPSIAMPVPMTTEQKTDMTMPVLLYLGTKDNLVGDAGFAYETALEFPNIQIEVLESGHLIAVEQRDHVNKTLVEFLGLD